MMQAAIITAAAVSLAIVRDTSDTRTAASLIGYLATAWAVAPMLGPMLGGALGQLVGWRASFVAFLVFGLVVLVLCWFDLGETNKTPSRTIGAQFRAYPELVRSGRFWGYAACMTFSTGAFYAFLGGAPFVAATVFGVPTASVGLYIGSITGGFVAGSFVSGRLAARHALTTMMIAGRLVACTGLALGLLALLAGLVDVNLLFGSCIFVGIGNGITMPSSRAGAMSVQPALAGSASGLSGALLVAGGAALSAITGALVTPANGPCALLAMMLLSSLLGLAAAMYVRWLDRRGTGVATGL
jgi:predicted MFS family arabinose efflux permease